MLGSVGRRSVERDRGGMNIKGGEAPEEGGDRRRGGRKQRAERKIMSDD
jgi:hypothetical protein